MIDTELHQEDRNKVMRERQQSSKIIIKKLRIVKIPVKGGMEEAKFGKKVLVVKEPVTKVAIERQLPSGVQSKLPIQKLPITKIPIMITAPSPMPSPPVAEQPQAAIDIEVAREVVPAAEQEAEADKTYVRAPYPTLDKNLVKIADVLHKVYTVPYPITNPEVITDALGGPDAHIKISATETIPVNEIVTELLAKSRVFEARWDVANNLNAPSWVPRVLKAMYGYEFPLQESGEVDNIMGFIDIDRVAISKLLEFVEFPIDNIAELILKLAAARNKFV
jgi:hypothetical protein